MGQLGNAGLFHQTGMQVSWHAVKPPMPGVHLRQHELRQGQARLLAATQNFDLRSQVASLRRLLGSTVLAVTG